MSSCFQFQTQFAKHILITTLINEAPLVCITLCINPLPSNQISGFQNKGLMSPEQPLTTSFLTPSKGWRESKTWFPVVEGNKGVAVVHTVHVLYCYYTVCICVLKLYVYSITQVQCQLLWHPNTFYSRAFFHLGFLNQEHLLQRSASMICSRPFQLWPCEHGLQTLWHNTLLCFAAVCSRL